MKFEFESQHRNRPDEELIADLVRVANKLDRDNVTIDQFNERRRFDSWFIALERRGLAKLEI